MRDPRLDAVSWNGLWVTVRRAAVGLNAAQVLEAATVMASKNALRWDAAMEGGMIALWVWKDLSWTLRRCFFFKSVRFASLSDQDWVGRSCRNKRCSLAVRGVVSIIWFAAAAGAALWSGEGSSWSALHM